MSECDRQRLLVSSLAAMLEKESGVVEIFETHISWVLVAEPFAYKFKKVVRFDFLDFSTLDARLFYCREEVRLNRRLAPEIYLEVLAIGGSAGHPVIGGAHAPIEYCVKMRSFAQHALWRHRLRHGLLSGGETDGLASEMARFHQAAAVAPADAAWGDLALLRAVAEENHAQIGALFPERAHALQAWSSEQESRLEPFFAERKRQGRIRECHGDLHSGNILTMDGKVQVFDCIEFNDSLRWIDVINDIAFIYMDLRFQGRPELAARCLNRYLEIGGDYEGVRVLRYYEVQRALVRAKVALLRARQEGADESVAEGLQYLDYAEQRMKEKPPALMITHGYSGSGKSVFARQVVECLGALQLRSDVERKRIHSAGADDRIEEGIYDRAATLRTYERLLALARVALESGMPVVVDAAFLKLEQRRQFAALAAGLNVPFFIFDLRASEATMRARVNARAKEGVDPSDAGAEVLEHQLRNHDPLSEDEMAYVIDVDAERALTAETVQALLERSPDLHLLRLQ